MHEENCWKRPDLMFRQNLLFPLAAAINLFSVTGLIIVAGFLGKSNLAADIAIIQGAVLAIFLSLSGNARNIILGSVSSEVIEKNLLYFRFLIMIPAVIAVYYLTQSAVEPPTYLFIGLVVRKCSEWVAELQLANREVQNNYSFAARYILTNMLAIFGLIVVLLIPPWSEHFYLILYLWAILPVLFAAPYIRFIHGLKQHKLNFTPLVPHMGSTVAIGVSTYVFRVLVIIFTGKALAGQMFAAYALGGIMSSVYVYALGPTLVMKNSQGSQKPLFLSVLFCVISGLLVILFGMFLDIEFYEPMFINAVGISLIGGGVMILAQKQRLLILQVFKNDVFVPDALTNILLIGSIPFAFFVFGRESIAFFFLWSAILAFTFYMPLSKRIS